MSAAVGTQAQPRWAAARSAPELAGRRAELAALEDELSLAMALAMTVITGSGIRGYLPRTICLICLTLMWMEAALG